MSSEHRGSKILKTFCVESKCLLWGLASNFTRFNPPLSSFVPHIGSSVPRSYRILISKTASDFYPWPPPVFDGTSGGMVWGDGSAPRCNEGRFCCFGCPPQRAVCSWNLVARGLFGLNSCCGAEFVQIPAFCGGSFCVNFVSLAAIRVLFTVQ